MKLGEKVETVFVFLGRLVAVLPLIIALILTLPFWAILGFLESMDAPVDTWE